MIDLPLVSIIIACRSVDQDTRKCIDECRKLNYHECEILVLPDFVEEVNADKVIVIATGVVKPSAKRNLGMRKAKGSIFAFIDSDAYPEREWLTNAVAYFLSNKGVGAITGPNLTPAEDNFYQQAGGDVLESFVGLGKLSRRYRKTKKDYETQDIMSCNFLLPREIAENLNGFDESLLTGEDYKLGLEILSTGKKIIYSPSVCVYHHRRPLFLPHLKQMWNYGRDKGLLMREFFSLSKLVYFLPSLFVIWVIGGMFVALFNGGGFLKLYALSLFGYLGIILTGSLKIANKKRLACVLIGICSTHIAYGIAFIKGIMTMKSMLKTP
ncbi:MAG: glycosyltransferase [Thermodesulfobacteriota bacterium]|nr:glycosyltransferase [Thermodesulfobacteriota bacterium]